MKISGFIFVRNAASLYYPVKQAIWSVLPVCDEFIVALGDCDNKDQTKNEILAINSPKIRIIDTVWDVEKYRDGTEMAHQTDIAISHCTGDWLFCIQADEVIHENDLPEIRQRCEEHLTDNNIEGLLFRFVHFWGDYSHLVDSHGWHKHEIRIVRNDPDIHSWRDSMSFRRIPEFDGISYRKKEGTHKLKVVAANATVYHYGWVRPPEYMRKKDSAFRKAFNSNPETGEFDFGPIDRYPVFKGTHPAVMHHWISNFNWKDKLQYSGKVNKNRKLHKQERLKYRIVTFFEKHVFCRPLWEFRNYILIRR